MTEPRRAFPIDPRYLFALGGALFGALSVAAGVYIGSRSASAARDGAPADRAGIEQVVENYLLTKPEIIPQAITRLQEREVAKVLDSNRAELETPFAGAWAGARDGDVVLVEFFDYNCPYCRAMHGVIAELIAKDPRLKVVWRDVPVLGPMSDRAALASLSAAKQGRYAAFQRALFAGEGRLTEERLIAAVRAAGMDELTTARDIQANRYRGEIEKNIELGRAIGLNGTPTYVVGNRIFSGAVSLEELGTAIAAARDAKG